MHVSSHKVVVCEGREFTSGHLVKQLLHYGVNVIRTTDIKPNTEWNQVRPKVENVTADLNHINEFYRAHENTPIRSSMGWESLTLLNDGLRITYDWIESQSEALACV